MSGQRSVVCTIAVGPHEELFEIARPGLEQFTRLHGHDLVAVHHDMSGGRPTSWGKVPLLRELLDSYDLVAWVDADAVVVDPRGDVFAATSRRTPFAVAVHRYDGLEVPNLGVMAVRSGRWSKRWFERLWRSGTYIDHKWWENAAALELLGYDVTHPCAQTRRSTAAAWRVAELGISWNSIPLDPAPFPNICHFPGMTQRDRIREMSRAAAAVVVAMPPDDRPSLGGPCGHGQAVGTRGLERLERRRG